MITAQDIEAFADENGAAMAMAAKFARRAQRGLPPDRWATTHEMHQVAHGIAALHRLIAIQSALIEALASQDGGK